jgi:hypothetical protein
MRTGNLYGGLALAGLSLFISATLVLLLPRKHGAVDELIAGEWSANLTLGLFQGCPSSGSSGHFAKPLTELYVVPRYTFSERRVRMSLRAETKFVIRL